MEEDISSSDPVAVIRQHLERAFADARRAEAELDAAKGRVERARGKLEGLRQLLYETRGPAEKTRPVRAYGGGPVMTPESVAKANWTALSRSVAILRLLRERQRPMGPAELSRELKALGRDRDEPRYVSSTLDNLKRRGLVRTIGKARWVAIDRAKEATEEVADE